MTPSLDSEFAAITAEIAISKAMDTPVSHEVRVRSAKLFCSVTEDIANRLEARAKMASGDGLDALSFAAATALRLHREMLLDALSKGAINL
jgi:hypothetical protein